MRQPVHSPAAAEIHYPSSDGKPMAENDVQRNAILYGVGALQVHFAGREDVYVSGDLLIYYEEGNPRVSVAPDVFVVFGVEDRMRMSYKVWEEGKGPDFVLEVASPGTWREDVGPKREVYARLGVGEYWLYDPLGGLLRPELQGYRLVGGEYEAREAVRLVDGSLALYSETLGLELRASDGEMRFRDPSAGGVLLSYEEECAPPADRRSLRDKPPRAGLKPPRRGSRSWKRSSERSAAERSSRIRRRPPPATASRIAFRPPRRSRSGRQCFR